MIFIDSNIFAKLFVEEPDSLLARSFFRYCITNKILLFAPALFIYEVLQIAIYYNYPVEDAFSLIEDHTAFNLTLVELSKREWVKAEEIVQSGHKKSGFPSLYDSSYHALALSKNSIFLTADKRHEAKTKQFGSIKLLEQWEDIFNI